MSYVSVGLLTALWCVFAASGGSKVRCRAAQRAFADSLRPLPLLPGRLVAPAAVLVTAVELLVVLGIGWSVVAAAAGWPAVRAGAAAVLVVTALLLAVLTIGGVLAGRGGTPAPPAPFFAPPPPPRPGAAGGDSS